MTLTEKYGNWLPKVMMKGTFFCLLFSFSIRIIAQEPPPRPLVVNVLPQTLSFGAFTLGAAGGTVIIDAATGSRDRTGDIMLLGMGYSFSTGQFELIANPGTLISLLGWPSATLNGSGGGTMSLSIDSTFPVTPFVISTDPPAGTIMNIGGTLTVQAIGLNPAGDYTGTFNITFIQE